MKSVPSPRTNLGLLLTKQTQHIQVLAKRGPPRWVYNTKHNYTLRLPCRFQASGVVPSFSFKSLVPSLLSLLNFISIYFVNFKTEWYPKLPIDNRQYGKMSESDAPFQLVGHLDFVVI